MKLSINSEDKKEMTCCVSVHKHINNVICRVGDMIHDYVFVVKLSQFQVFILN